MSNFGQSNDQDVELNIAPIIDCFTVLITYLLVTASFISLSALEVGVAAAGQSSSKPPTDIPVSVGLQLSVAHGLTIKITGGANINESINVDPKNSQWDTDGLSTQLETIKKNYTKVEDISVTAEPLVTYKDIVKIIEAVKKSFEKVYLAG
jgi:biopolymer transport protein ExbD